MGEQGLFEIMVEDNVELFKECGVERMVTSYSSSRWSCASVDPGAFALDQEWRQLVEEMLAAL